MTATSALTWSRLADHRDHIWARLPFVVPMAAKLARRCAGNRCGELASLVAELRAFLLDHLEREDRLLAGLRIARPAVVIDTIGELHREHLAVAELLRRMRISAGGYRAPEGACATERALYRELARLERHIRCQVALEERLLSRSADPDAVSR